MPCYHSQPHIWRYFNILCVCSDILNLAHKNSPELAQINRLSAILLSGEVQENRIVGSEDIENSYFLKHFIFDLAMWYSFVESPFEIIAAKLSLLHARGTNCTTALASELVESAGAHASRAQKGKQRVAIK